MKVLLSLLGGVTNIRRLDWMTTVVKAGTSEFTLEQAQHSPTAFATSQDRRRREGRDGSTTAAPMFAAERLSALPPTVFPVVVTQGAHRDPAGADLLA